MFLPAHAQVAAPETPLREAYPRTLHGAVIKELDHLIPQYRAFVEASPFVVLASAGTNGLDCSPRGDAPGFVRVLDDRSIEIPDARGNNRLDTMGNIARDPRIGAFFLIPGVDETLRIRGRASVHLPPDATGPAPASIRIAITSVFFHCARALRASGLWDPARHARPGTVPSAREIMAAIRAGALQPGADRSQISGG